MDMVCSELVPGLPSELGIECLSRLPCTAHPVASQACRQWRKLIGSSDFYYLRKKQGFTRKLGCLVQSLAPNPPTSGDVEKIVGAPRPAAYGISVFDPVGPGWERLDRVHDFPSGLPLFCRICSAEGKLVVMGGWHPESYEPLKTVFVYDFATGRWLRGTDMPEKRSFFAIGAWNGKVVVAGGHEENKNALRSASVYNLRNDQWSELRPMSQERDECEGIVIGREFWAVSGYKTERQGAFGSSAEVLNMARGEWSRVEERVWPEGKCPASRVLVGRDGRIKAAATARVDLGGRVLTTGTQIRGDHEVLFHMVEARTGKVEPLEPPFQFSGSVQSSCSAEL